MLLSVILAAAFVFPPPQSVVLLPPQSVGGPVSAVPQAPSPPPTVRTEVEFDAFMLQPLSDNGYRLTATVRSRLAAANITHIRLALTLKDCTAAGVCEAIGQTET